MTAIETDGSEAVVTCADGGRHAACHVVANPAPAVLAELLGEPRGVERPEGSQLKINMLLERLPKPRDGSLSPEEAFTGTFHVNEGYQQLRRAYGRLPRAGSRQDLRARSIATR